MNDKIIDKKIIDEISLSSNIINIISDYITCKKKGSNYVAICPFHDDKHPSLVISLEKKIYKCFSCGEAGGIFNFIQKIENVNFIESVKILANKIGYKLNLNINSKNFLNENLYKINLDTMNYFKSNLFISENYNALTYLTKERNIKIDDIIYFDIGYSTKNKNDLYNFLIKKNYSISDIEKLNLISIKNNNEIIDQFNNKIIFPIFNKEKKIVGFSGRSLNNTTFPKYINTKNNLIFTKSNVIYNLDKAIKFIRKEKFVIIVEGYFDIVALKKINIENVVSIMGTSMSNFQINEIKKITKNIYMFFDGDKAGFDASIKITSKLLQNNLDVKIINNDSNLDPDEILKNNPQKLINMIKNPLDPFEYLKNKSKINNLTNANEFEEKYKLLLNSISSNNTKNIIKNNMKLSNLITNNDKKSNIELFKNVNNWVFLEKNDIIRSNDVLSKNLIKQFFLSKKAIEIYKENFQLISISKKYMKIIEIIFKIYNNKETKKLNPKLILDHFESEKWFLQEMNSIFNLIKKTSITYSDRETYNIIKKMKEIYYKIKKINLVINLQKKEINDIQKEIDYIREQIIN